MSPPQEREQLAARIGAAIRQRRRAAGMTLTTTSRIADISVSHLSNIENGQTLASLPVLAKVATALKTSLAELTRDEDRLVIEAARVPSAPGEPTRLSHPTLQLDVAAAVYPDGAVAPCPLPLPDRDLFVYVLAGAVDAEVDGAHYRLGTGDALDARQPLSAGITARGETTVFWSTAPGYRR